MVFCIVLFFKKNMESELYIYVFIYYFIFLFAFSLKVQNTFPFEKKKDFY